MIGKGSGLSVGEFERSLVEKQTQPEVFLAEMEAVAPLSVLLSLMNLGE